MFDEKCMTFPRGTEFQERSIIAIADVVIADHSKLEYGLVVPGNLYIGENVRIEGDLNVSGESRIDSWTIIEGDFRCEGNVYLGHSVKISGKLIAGASLDVGENVDIGQGFEANGWITIRDPIPIVVYVIIYILQMMGMGKSEEVEKMIRELEEIQEEDIRVRRGYLYIPKWTRVTQDVVRARKGFGLKVYPDCRLLGNFSAQSVELGERTELVGSIKAEDNVKIGRGSQVEGSIYTRGTVVVADGVMIGGRINASRVEMDRNSMVVGRIRAEGGILFLSEEGEEREIVEQELFEKSVDLGKVLE